MNDNFSGGAHAASRGEIGGKLGAGVSSQAVLCDFV
jgi:hypothetical protein